MWYDFFKLFWYAFFKGPLKNEGFIMACHDLRPTCKRCNGPLDIFPDAETGRYEWCCNNPKPMFTDEEFTQRWANLPGDDVAKLTRELDVS